MYKLRELERKDIAVINQWRNDEEIIETLGAPFRFINKEVDEKWFESYMQSRTNTIRCAIVTEDCDNILGLVTLADINYINRSATLHLIVGESAQNKGVGTFAVQEICHHAFFNYGLHRIELNVLASNQRAIHVYEKCGFIREGLKKEAVFKNGLYVDMAIYALINTTIK
ncbi:MAG: GNAT family N-acetyltransferase [Alphaproteobacteria bacterium]|nr:GNAT family N-acetyltransferase [Alphaproteobacteria bacterium]